MEFTTKEILSIEKTLEEVAETQIRELNDLQLALVGGGTGSVIIG